MNNEKFDQASYWQQRVTGQIDLGVVGHRSLGRAYNEFIYRRRVEVLTATLASLNLDPTQLSVLDIGCGSGFYVELWRSLGVSTLTGIDISQESVNRMASKYPGYTFMQADVTQTSAVGEIKEKFSVVTIFDVLYHITDDHAARAALRNASNALAEDGHLLIFDQLLDKDYSLRPHVKFRGRENFNRLLQDANLELIGAKGLFVLLEPPVFGWKPLDYSIAGAYKLLGAAMRRSEPLGHATGHVAYKLDNALRKLGISTPNHELIIATRRK